MSLEANIHKLRTAAPGTLLATAEEIVTVLHQEREDDERRWDEQATAYETRIEDLDVKTHPDEVVSQAIQEAHRRAHHLGHWESCPNLVCRSLEEWVLQARRERT